VAMITSSAPASPRFSWDLAIASDTQLRWGELAYGERGRNLEQLLRVLNGRPTATRADAERQTTFYYVIDRDVKSSYTAYTIR
jgi:hypothetical protein